MTDTPGSSFKTVTDHKYTAPECHEKGCQYLVLTATEQYRAGWEAGRNAAAQLVEDANVPEGFRGTQLYGEFERGGDNYLTQAAKAIRALEPPDTPVGSKERWISVEERLPSDYGQYWVWAVIRDEDNDLCGAVKEVDWDKDGGWLGIEGHTRDGKVSQRVTHWMPLPQPPVAEQKEKA